MKKSPNATPIIQYDLTGHAVAEYESLSEAARILKVSLFGLSKSINNKRPFHSKHVFRYKDEKKNIILDMNKKKALEEAEKLKREMEDRYNRVMYPLKYASSFSFVIKREEQNLLQSACQQAWSWGINNQK